MALGSIVIDLLMRTGAFNNDAKLAERRLKEMEKTAKQAGAAIGAAVGTAAVALTTLTRRAISSMDDLNKMAGQIGVATEELTGLRYAAEQMANVSAGQFDMALRRMTRRISEAAEGGGPAAAALEQLGLSAQQLARLSPDEQFRRVADAMSGMSDQGARLRTTMALMDTEGMPLVNMLQQGAGAIREMEEEAARLGQTIDSDAARAASDFESNLVRLKAGVDGLFNAVAADLLPDLVRLTDEFARATTQGDRLRETASDIADVFRAAGAVASFLVDAFRVVSGVVRGVMMDMIALSNATDAAFKAMRGDWSGAAQALRDMATARQMAAEASDDIARVFQGPGPADRSIVFAGEGEPVGLFQKSREQVAMEQAREAAAEAARLAQEEAKARAAAADAAAAGAKAQAEAEKELAAAIRAAEEAERARDEAMRAAEQTRLDWLNRIDDITARADGPAAMAVLNFRRALAEANAALATGVITIDEYQKYAEGLGRSLGDVTAEMDTATGEMTVFADQAARNMQDAFADFLFDPFEDGVSGMAKAFGDALRRMAAEAAASEIFKLIGNWASNYTGAGSGWINAIGGALSGPRATGGPVVAGGTYLVGEQGPELLRMGANSGTVIPNNRISGLTPAMPEINLTIVKGANEDRVEQPQRNSRGGMDLKIMMRTQMAGMIADGSLDQVAGQAWGVQRRGVALG